MKHRIGYRKLSKPTDQRLAILHALARELIMRGQIETTLTRAKEARRIVEKLITLAKRNNLHAKRMAMRILRDRKALKQLFEEVAPKMANKNGGYVKIIRLGARRGDSAEMALISLAEE